MFYCEQCMLPCNENKCPGCGTKGLSVLKGNDPVYLFSKEAIWAGGIEDILKEHGIPCLKQGIHGAAITAKMGDITETYRFFVPYSAYEKSKELLCDYFPADR